MDPEDEKDLASLINSIPAVRPPLLIEKLEQREVRAILGYITYLERMVTSHNSGKTGTLRDEVAKGEFDKHDLDTCMIKLVAMAAQRTP